MQHTSRVTRPAAMPLHTARRPALRRGLAVTAVCLLAVGWRAVGWRAVGWRAVDALADVPARARPVQAVTVRPGDTLWSYAASVVGPGRDVRDVVADIMELNGMHDSRLSVGGRILLPDTSRGGGL